MSVVPALHGFFSTRLLIGRTSQTSPIGSSKSNALSYFMFKLFGFRLCIGRSLAHDPFPLGTSGHSSEASECWSLLWEKAGAWPSDSRILTSLTVGRGESRLTSWPNSQLTLASCTLAVSPASEFSWTQRCVHSPGPNSLGIYFHTFTRFLLICINKVLHILWCVSFFLLGTFSRHLSQVRLPRYLNKD